MSKRNIKIATVQFAMGKIASDNEVNVIKHIHDAASQGADLILLPELHNHAYFCQSTDAQYFALAEAIPGRTTAKLGELAKQLNVVIVCSIFEKRAAGVYHNTAVVIENNGEIAGIYRKMHIPDDPGYYEKYYFTPGDIGFSPIQTSLGKLGVLVCWDQWFPEAARIMALSGAEILLFPTAIGWNPEDSVSEKERQLDAWVTIQRAHAIANGIPVAVSNRCGLEADPSKRSKGINFWGASFITGPFGEKLANSPRNCPSVMIAETSLSQIEIVRQTWPFLRDRRIDAYRGILKRHHD